MNILKKTYITPKTNIEKLSVGTYLLGNFICSGKKIFNSETLCPFNNCWCADKQEILDEWRNAVKLYVEQGKDYMFHTSGNMFDGCPYNYTKLCAEHKQRQRD